MMKLEEKAADTSRSEIVNVSKLILGSGKKVRFQTQRTSVPLFSGGKLTLTASAAPDAYYVSLTESSEIRLANDD